MEATVQYLNGVKFNVAVCGHSVVCDLPVENKGEDAGIAPPIFCSYPSPPAPVTTRWNTCACARSRPTV